MDVVILFSFLLHLPPGKRCAVPSAVDSVTFSKSWAPQRTFLEVRFGVIACVRDAQNIRFARVHFAKDRYIPYSQVLFASLSYKLVPTSVYPFSVYEARTLYSAPSHLLKYNPSETNKRS
jgi:hypothetical protein